MAERKKIAVTAKFKGNEGTDASGTSIDVSETGALISAATAPLVGEKLNMSFEARSGKSKVLDVPGVVVRVVAPHPKRKTWQREFAVQFTDLPEAKVSELKNMAAELGTELYVRPGSVLELGEIEDLGAPAGGLFGFKVK